MLNQSDELNKKEIPLLNDSKVPHGHENGLTDRQTCQQHVGNEAPH